MKVEKAAKPQKIPPAVIAEANKFSHNDAGAILQILMQAPLQNLSAADPMKALLGRFNAFCLKHLGMPPRPVQPPQKAGK